MLAAGQQGHPNGGESTMMSNGGSRSPTNGNSRGGNEQSSTKAKLNDILESFQAFDSDMKIGTRHRREKDEHRISQLTTELTRLEKTLNQEIKRRVEMNKSVQTVRKFFRRAALFSVGALKRLLQQPLRSCALGYCIKKKCLAY